MKIEYWHNRLKIHFEENDKFAGKKISVRGENEIDTDTFAFKKNDVNWLFQIEEKNFRTEPIDDNIKDEVIAYIISEGKKQGENLAVW
ncbi:MAG: hypothetical protein FWC97_02350 [Treponema sp.]|nr:hypothetical protein [Treponema sp.]